MRRTTISTHVLDTAAGGPAAGVHVALLDHQGQTVGEGTTGVDGRIADLVPAGVEAGRYSLVFQVEEYFEGRPHLFQTVSLTVSITEAGHHHLPLLLGPYSCVSYRGS